MTLVWGFGLPSLGGLLAGAGAWAFLRGHDERLTYRRIAEAAVAIGTVGLVVTIAAFGPASFAPQGSSSPVFRSRR